MNRALCDVAVVSPRTKFDIRPKLSDQQFKNVKSVAEFYDYFI